MELSLPFPVVLGQLIEVVMYLLTYYFHIMFIEIRGSYVLNGKCECLLDSKVKKTNGKKFKHGTKEIIWGLIKKSGFLKI